MKPTLPFVFLATFTLAGCNPWGDPQADSEPCSSESDEGSGDEQAQVEGTPESQPTSQPTEVAETLAVPDSQWVADRVAEANERLGANQGGEIIAAAIEQAGGLERWFSNGPIHFRFRYVPVEGQTRDTFQTIDTWRSLAVHRTPTEPESRFGWDGETAWTELADGAELGTNPRFWSLTPYYFVGVPFVLADPGVTLAYEGEVDLEGRTWELVRATFGQGVGDAPDDFYVVLVDKETRRLGGVRYVVSYPGFFPEGGHSPEKVMFYDGSQTIDGITLPESFRTFAWGTEGEEGWEVTGPAGEVVTNSYLSDVSFDDSVPLSFFAVPEGAAILEGY